MDEASLHDYVAVLWRRRWIVVAALLVAVAAAVVALLVQTPRYRAEAELLRRRTYSQTLLVDEGGQVASATDAERQLSNEVTLIESQAVRDVVADRYDGPLDVDDVAAEAPSSAANDSIVLTATSTDAAEATRLVNLYAETYVAERRDRQLRDLEVTSEQIQGRLDDLRAQIDEVGAPLDDLSAQVDASPQDSAERTRAEERLLAAQRQVLPQLGPLLSRESTLRGQLTQLEVNQDLASTGGVEILAAAETPDDPVSPSPVRYLVVAIVAGLAGGAALAWVRDRLDDSVRTKEDGEALTGLPTLGIVPRVTDRQHQADEVLALRQPTSPAAEAYRSLRTSVRFLGVERQTTTILVTSAMASEGKTVTAANLAVVLAQSGEQVLLVDGDLRRPRVHDLFDVPARPGLTEVLVGDADITNAVVADDGLASLHLLPAGSLPPNPAEILDGRRARDVLESLAATYDAVVVDSSPVLPVTDARVLATQADAVLVVVSYQETSKRGLGRALELLRQIDAPIVGTVLNQVPVDQDYGSEAYYHRDGRGDRAERSRRRLRVPDAAGVTVAARRRDGNGASGPGGPGSGPVPEGSDPQRN
jgi:tyrosine-protein kinase